MKRSIACLRVISLVKPDARFTVFLGRVRRLVFGNLKDQIVEGGDRAFYTVQTLVRIFDTCLRFCIRLHPL